MSYCWPMPPICSTTFEGQFYDQIFPPSFFGELSDLMGIAQNAPNLSALRQGHYQAFSEFVTGQIEQRSFQSLKAENARLDRVAKDADRLLQSLTGLYDFGQAQGKLKREVETNPTSFTSSNGDTLASLLDDTRPDNPFFIIKQFVSDISISAQRAKVTTPKPSEGLPKSKEGDFDLAPIEALVCDRDLAPSRDDAADLARWKEQSEAHKLGGDHALLQFVKRFKTAWVALSPHPFTQGHYYEKIGHEPARTVAALKLCFASFAPEINPQAIVTAIRKVQAG
ncbi:hypothetical protein EDD52_1498 [Primorskyibacter sedentarius]|uniref:Uncharacterized protein n=1 Tax=Primorskyibacter sedentarius TaxID=745311 RepID=A0A4R3IN78_9RHOB|nr:hypothetical protein EDD52_1498 [Primorskyibacter sedentarius]